MSWFHHAIFRDFGLTHYLQHPRRARSLSHSLCGYIRINRRFQINDLDKAQKRTSDSPSSHWRILLQLYSNLGIIIWQLQDTTIAICCFSVKHAALWSLNRRVVLSCRQLLSPLKCSIHLFDVLSVTSWFPICTTVFQGFCLLGNCPQRLLYTLYSNVHIFSV
jgi:hypothetical protein